MCKKQLSNLFSLKKSTILMFALVFVSFVSEVNVLVGQTLPEEIIIKGNVKEAKSNTPLPGVSVVIKGKTLGTITDIDGNFELKTSKTDVLAFSFIGYAIKEVPVGNNTFFDIALEEDIMGLEEIVVTGYGVQKKSDLTGAVSSVSSEKLNSVPIPSVEHALQGMAAGVNIIPKTGKPGSS
jgi:hypothetical protein